MYDIQSWKMTKPGELMQKFDSTIAPLQPDEVLVRISGCGVCHTDLGFYYDGVRTVKAPPLTLGHEISGFVQEAGEEFNHFLGKAVIIPAVLPCGECDLCRKGRGTICRQQKMPGNHIDGGFASHIVVPGKYLCPVAVEAEDSFFGDSGLTLKELSVIADAVTTPYQAVKNSGLVSGDLAVFIGVGGIGGYGVQIAHALGASVVAIDIDDAKLRTIAQYGAALTLNAQQSDNKTLRKTIQAFAAENALPKYEWKIFETSGSKAGQKLAFSLLTFGATLNIVGFTMATVDLRLSNLMAYDARAIGNWGCHPKYYPEVLELVKQGRIQLAPFVQTFPLSEINDVFQRVRQHEIKKRPILVPDFD